MSYFPEAIDVIADACRQIKGARLDILDGARRRGYKGRSFHPIGQMNHHTGRGSWSGLTHWITKGSSIAPLANAMTSNPYETDGICIVRIVACGRANHAGRGIWTPDIPRDSGNAYLWGWEHQNDGGSKWHPLHNEVILSLNVALIDAFGWKVHNTPDHKDYAPGRKVDRYAINSDAWRNSIKVRLSGGDNRPKPAEDSIRKGSTYTVQKGDTLASIADRAGLRWQDIYNANRDKIADPDKISVGQKLSIPTGTVSAPKEDKGSLVVYTVQKGDTLKQIGAKFNMDWKKIYSHNREQITNPNVIKPGQRFEIPGVYEKSEPKPAPKPAPKSDDRSFAERMPLVSRNKNDRGLWARIVQGLLVANEHAPRNTIRPDGTLDGIFGSGTEAAVKAFQKSKRLSVDGIVGPNTWSALIGSDTVLVSVDKNKRGVRARRVQGLLIANRVIPKNGTIQSDGTLDGIFGRGTEAAVKAFQKREGLKQDGIVGPKTREALLNLN